MGPHLMKLIKCSKMPLWQNYRGRTRILKTDYPVNLPDMNKLKSKPRKKPVQRGENESLK